MTLRMKKFLMVCLWIISMYWCKDLFIAYIDEAESMQFHFEQAVSFPDITVCNSKFMTVLKPVWSYDYNDANFPPLGHVCPQNENVMNAGLQSRIGGNFGNVGGKGYDEYNFKEIIQTCLSNNPSTSILAKLSCFDYSNDIALFKNITLISNSGKVLVLNLTLLKKVFHEKYGICYTLPGKYWNR